MKKHYIKLNWIYAWAGAECFSICQRLHIKREGLNKKYFSACFVFASSLMGQMQFHNFGKT